MPETHSLESYVIFMLETKNHTIFSCLLNFAAHIQMSTRTG